MHYMASKSSFRHICENMVVPRDEYIERLLEDLRLTLGAPSFDRSWVTCLIVQVRKVVEHCRESGRARYGVLNLFCNWALHTKIDRDPHNIKLFFQAFDIKEGMEISEWFESEYFKQIVLLRGFRTSLDEFLEDHHLSDWLTKSTDDWYQFVHLYAEVVAAAPLQRKNAGVLPSEVAEVRLDRVKAPRMEQECVRVRVVLHDGRDYFSTHLFPLRDFSAEAIYKLQRPRFPA